MRFISKIPIVLAVVMLAVAGCNSHKPIGPGGSSAIDFSVEIPTVLPAGDYYAMSGVVLRPDFRMEGDSLVPFSARSLYAQFYPSGGAAVPAIVLLNNNEFTRQGTSDTFRLGSAVNPILSGQQLWTIGESTSDTVQFRSGALDELDSVMPFRENLLVRSDTQLVIRWRPPTTSSGGVMITMLFPGVPRYSVIAAELGSYAVPKAQMATFSGAGKVILTRFRNDLFMYKGKRVIVTRLAQREYDVTVQS